MKGYSYRVAKIERWRKFSQQVHEEAAPAAAAAAAAAASSSRGIKETRREIFYCARSTFLDIYCAYSRSLSKNNFFIFILLPRGAYILSDAVTGEKYLSLSRRPALECFVTREFYRDSIGLNYRAFRFCLFIVCSNCSRRTFCVTFARAGDSLILKSTVVKKTKKTMRLLVKQSDALRQGYAHK